MSNKSSVPSQNKKKKPSSKFLLIGFLIFVLGVGAVGYWIFLGSRNNITSSRLEARNDITSSRLDILEGQLSSLFGQGYAYQKEGNLEEALKSYEEVLSIIQKNPQIVSEKAIKIIQKIVGLYIFVNNFEKADKWNEKVLDMQKKIYKDANHPSIATSLYLKAVIYLYTGKLEEALTCQEQAVIKTLHFYKGTCKSVETMLSVLDDILKKPELSSKRKEDTRKNLKPLLKKYLGSSGSDRLESRNDITSSRLDILKGQLSSLFRQGHAYQEAGNLEEALKSYEEVLSIIQKNPQIVSEEAIGVIQIIVAAYISAYNFKKADEWNEKVLDMQKKIYKDANHPSIARSLCLKAKIYLHTGKLEEALTCQEQAVIKALHFHKGTCKAVETMLSVLDDILKNPKLSSKRKEDTRKNLKPLLEKYLGSSGSDFI